jgi:two-component sensor histidine kinase
LNDQKVIETREAMQFVEKFTTALGERTLLSTKSPLLDAEGKITGIIGVSTDITEREHRAKQLQFILKELSHRSKNLLMIIQAIARQSIRQSASLEDFESRFNDRLASLSRLHDLLVQEEWKGAALQAVAQTQTNPFGEGRVKITGPALMLKPDVAQVISMILHELATNASKYGALSAVQGQVALSWDYVGNDRKRLFVRWEEVGGPPVMAPTSSGFGTLVLERMALQIQGASSSVKFNSPGVIWYLEAPVSSFVELPETEKSTLG